MDAILDTKFQVLAGSFFSKGAIPWADEYSALEPFTFSAAEKFYGKCAE